MSDKSKIEWTASDDGIAGATWNPTTGCDKISPGCGLPRFEGDDTGGCYALTLAKRLKAMGSAKYQNDGDPRTSGPGFGLTLHPDALRVPLGWREPRRVFVNSMSDLFHARVPASFTARVWATMALTSQHTYQILTKRPERLASILGDPSFRARMARAIDPLTAAVAAPEDMTPWPLPNVHLGTSIELDRYSRRADDLREAPAVLRFLSLEPLLGPLPSLNLDGIGWVIIGGESGAHARRMQAGWVRDIIAQCRDSGVPVFVKQLGSVLGRELGAGSKGGDWSSWPGDLRIREFPRTAEAAPS